MKLENVILDAQVILGDLRGTLKALGGFENLNSLESELLARSCAQLHVDISGLTSYLPRNECGECYSSTEYRDIIIGQLLSISNQIRLMASAETCLDKGSGEWEENCLEIFTIFAAVHQKLVQLSAARKSLN